MKEEKEEEEEEYTVESTYTPRVFGMLVGGGGSFVGRDTESIHSSFCAMHPHTHPNIHLTNEKSSGFTTNILSMIHSAPQLYYQNVQYSTLVSIPLPPILST